MAGIRRFLELAQAEWPTVKTRHNITLSTEGILEITLFLGDNWHSFRVSEDEFDDPYNLIAHMQVALGL